MSATVLTRPGEPGDARYFLGTACGMVRVHLGSDFVDRGVIERLVGDVLSRSEKTVATSSDDPEILGYIATAPDRVIEFMYLRRSLEEVPIRAAASVVRALLGDRRVVTFRRPQNRRVIQAVQAAQYGILVVPVAI